jgi:hypothetical protein
LLVLQQGCQLQKSGFAGGFPATIRFSRIDLSPDVLAEAKPCRNEMLDL